MPSLDVCLSVRLSVTRRYCVENAILVSYHCKGYDNIPIGSPDGDVECRMYENRDVREQSLYFGNDTR